MSSSKKIVSALTLLAAVFALSACSEGETRVSTGGGSAVFIDCTNQSLGDGNNANVCDMSDDDVTTITNPEPEAE